MEDAALVNYTIPARMHSTICITARCSPRRDGSLQRGVHNNADLEVYKRVELQLSVTREHKCELYFNDHIWPADNK